MICGLSFLIAVERLQSTCRLDLDRVRSRYQYQEPRHALLDGVAKYSRRLTATSETNMTPVYRSNSGFNPARIGSTLSCETTVISITRLSVSLNIGWAV